MVVTATMIGDEAVEPLCSRLAASNTPLAANGLWGSSAPMLAALLADRLQKPLLYLTAHLEQADNARDDIETILERPADLLPAWETLPGEGSGSGEIAGERARLCQALRSEVEKSTPIIVAPIQALTQPVPSPAGLDRHSLELAVGDRHDPEEIAAWLIERGFERLDPVEEPGDFALRGGILDIFATSDTDPVRLEFFGDEVESIRQFELGSQRSTREIPRTRITRSPDPATAKPADTTTFLNYLPADTLVVLHEPVEIDETARTVMDRLNNPRGHFRFDSIVKRLASFSQLHLSRFPVASVGAGDTVRVSCEPLPTFDTKASDATRQLIALAEDHAVVVYCDNPGEEERLRELIDQVLTEDQGRDHDQSRAREEAVPVRSQKPLPDGRGSDDAVPVLPQKPLPYGRGSDDAVPVLPQKPLLYGRGSDNAVPVLPQKPLPDGRGSDDAVPVRSQKPLPEGRGSDDAVPVLPQKPLPDCRGSDDSATSQPPSDAAAARIETRIGSVAEGFQWRPDGIHNTIDDECSDPQARARGFRDQIAGHRTHSLALGARNESPARSLVVVPHHQFFRRYRQRRRLRKVPTSRPIESFLDLQEGDIVVHISHGIAKYMGMKTMRKGDSRKSEEFLTLRFAESATMHVPVTQIDLVQKYVGAKGQRPPLSKLGGTRWKTTKERVEEAVTDLASDLLRIQAERESQPGIAFPNDTHWQTEFENAFLYTETPDQITAVRDIKADQSRMRPMDRLLCGDVGYGKTELAMRAAFKTVEFGKQVAVLVPTTVLAEQHYRTMTERMVDYPFRIECLNRFRSPKQQKEIVAAARKGQVDILIGTHRIVSKDVGFADLGLVIVDEEQRFGVEHKERLKRLRSTVDVLTLTATPIPRTLHMAMVGLRDISSLATPPMDRRSISTRICNWGDDLVREAVVRELNRDGQIFFVHNRVHSIQGMADRIACLVPDARIVIGHGQMSGDDLERIMLKFIRHEADILVCTTIIEAGLDIPNANTIFIDRADRFGLADLHQLRGRVGRYKHRAYCYLLLSADRPLTSTAARRLKAIEEFSDLGAGFRIAMRDLEIRGAGNILGSEQSGQIAAVGYELYCQLLEKSVKRMRGEPHQERVGVHLELDVEAYIPKAYIASDRQRMECYRRFAACRAYEDVDQLSADMSDAYGAIPETVHTLLTLAEIRVRASQAGITTIMKKEPDVVFQFDGEIKRIEPFFSGVSGDVSLPDGRTLHWRPPDHYFHGDTLLVILRNLFRPPAARADESATGEKVKPLGRR